MRDAVTQRQQEVVVVVMTRAEHRVGLLHQLLPLPGEVRRDINRAGSIADKIGVDLTRRCRVERDLAQILARDHRRIH